MKPTRVFVSYAHDDKEWRNAALDIVRNTPGFELLDTESFASGQTLWPMVEELITTAELFVLLVGPHASEASWLKQEYDVAKRVSVPVVVFVAGALRDQIVHGVPRFSAPDSSYQRYREYIEFAQESVRAHVVSYVSNADELRNALTEALVNFKNAHAEFEISFDPEMSESEVKAAFEALADYYRACGGVGLQVEFERQEAEVREPVHA